MAGLGCIQAQTGTMPKVSVEDFAAQVRSAREEQRLSRSGLERLSGVSAALIEKLEGRAPPWPRRYTVIDLTHALGMDTDRWLRDLGYEPLTATQRAQLPSMDDPFPELEEIWPRLTPAQKQAIVGVLRAFVRVTGRPVATEEGDPVTVVRLDGDSEHANDESNDPAGHGSG